MYNIHYKQVIHTFDFYYYLTWFIISINLILIIYPLVT